MDYSEINTLTVKALNRNKQNSIFTNNWLASGEILSNLAIDKKDFEKITGAEGSFLAESTVLPELLKSVNIDTLSLSELVMISMAAKAIEAGDSKAATFFRDTTGGKPVDKIERKKGSLADLSDEELKLLLSQVKVRDEED